MSSRIITIIILALIVLALYFIVLRPPNAAYAPPQVNEPVMCTMDAMQCPDGSYVGRSGPTCEFVCPN
jgi:hypothetical protein